MRHLDGIYRHRDYCEGCQQMQRVVSRFETFGIIGESIAILFIYNQARPCKSRVIKEVTDNRITMPATAQAIAISYIKAYK